MRRAGCTLTGLLIVWFVQSCATPLALASDARVVPCIAARGNAAAESLDDLRTNDGFYRQVVKWQGQALACRYSAGTGARAGENHLALSWANGTLFEQSFLLPETAVMRYSRPEGLSRADEVIAALRTYASQRGLHVDWTAPHPQSEGGARIVEYADPDPGVNGIVRLVYDRQDRLVAVSLSLAL